MTPGSPLVRRSAVAAQSDGLIRHYHDAICTDRVAIVTGGLAKCRPGGRAQAREPGPRRCRRLHPGPGCADSIVEEVLAAAGTTLTIPRRSRRRARLERMFAELTEAFGGIDILVHAAGQVILGPVADYDLDRFDTLQRTNVRGTFVVNRQAARQLREGRSSTCLAAPSPRPCRPTPPPRRAARRWRR